MHFEQQGTRSFTRQFETALGDGTLPARRLRLPKRNQ